ncbi:hypothetical protein Slin15195_G079230 [Septoria linicola]|uniref:DUF6604 domain-containing protein n=1 Tax=Septoria linicola TaxID=215465 RepID=A0A9Q9ASH0_9PEZI|nr:hypothetical protein Slin14017_G040430 [Septoria linicola]USW54604.1 hypothetical protein Slin15195_G079230 [Septoria linicola]
MATTSDYSTIVGRHARYKAGQQIVVTWLANTAANYKDLATYFQYLTKTKPKTRQGAVRVATHELIGLADIIIKGDPPTNVPEDIFKVLQDVIAGRRATNVWYYSQPKQSDHDGHLFSIDALERVRDILQPGRSKISVGDKVTNKQKTKSTGLGNAIEQEVDSLSNVFACLDVHEPATEPLGSAAKTTPAAAKVTHGSELEDDQDQDIFALWCFLEDMNDIRQMIRELWADVRRGEVTTVVAGLTTELAVGMIHRSYDDFVATYPQFSHWTSIASFLGLQVYINNNVVYLLPAKRTNATTPANSQSNAADPLCTSATFLLRVYV